MEFNKPIYQIICQHFQKLNLIAMSLITINSVWGIVIENYDRINSAAMAQTQSASQITAPKLLPSIGLQDLPTNLFTIANCSQDLPRFSQSNDLSKLAVTNTFCFQRTSPQQEEFILGTIICHGCNTEPKTSAIIPLSSDQKAISALESKDLTAILYSINQNYHHPLTWLSLKDFTLENLGDGNLGLDANGDNRNGNYQYFRIIVFGRNQILAILVSSHSSMTLPVLNLPEIAYGLDRRLITWLKK